MSKEFFVSCECGCDVLRVEPFDDIKAMDDEDDILWLSIYRSCRGEGLWTRIRNAFDYLRHGSFAFTDMTIKKKELRDLIVYLQMVKLDMEKNEDK